MIRNEKIFLIKFVKVNTWKMHEILLSSCGRWWTIILITFWRSTYLDEEGRYRKLIKMWAATNSKFWNILNAFTCKLNLFKDHYRQFRKLMNLKIKMQIRDMKQPCHFSFVSVANLNLFMTTFNNCLKFVWSILGSSINTFKAIVIFTK